MVYAAEEHSGGVVVQSLVTEIVDVIVIIKTGRWFITLPSCCSNGNHWIPIINVPLESQGGVMVAVVVPQIPNYRSTQRSLLCLPLSPPEVAAIVHFWLGECVVARGYDGNVTDKLKGVKLNLWWWVQECAVAGLLVKLCCKGQMFIWA